MVGYWQGPATAGPLSYVILNNMNFYDSVLRNLPNASYKLNTGGTAYVDISGNGNFTTGTLVWTSSLLCGSAKSLAPTPAAPVQFSTSVFKVGRELHPFSIESTAIPLTGTGYISILSHNGRRDGLEFSTDFINFTVEFNLGSLYAQWEIPDFPEAYHVVGIYTGRKLELWVNGEVAASTEIPEEYLASGFSSTTTGNLYAGQSANASERLALDGVTMYAHALSASQVKENYAASRDAVPALQAVGQFSGQHRDGTSRDIVMQKVFDDSLSWQEAVMDKVSVADGSISPTRDEAGLSFAGQWTGVLDIGATELTSIYGVKAEWNGDGAYTVSTSIDGGTVWNAVNNGELANGTQGLNAVDKQLLVRVLFTGGVSDDPARVRSMTLTVYGSNTIYGYDSSKPFTITGNVSTSLETNEPIEMNERSGMHFYGGTVLIQPETTGSVTNILATEMWVKVRGSAATTLMQHTGGTVTFSAANTLDYTGASGFYINGVGAATGVAVKRNEWMHLLYLSTISTNLTIGSASGLMDVAMIATYPATFNSTQASALYSSYNQKPVLKITDGQVPTIAETGSPYVMTNYQWSVNAGQES